MARKILLFFIGVLLIGTILVANVFQMLTLLVKPFSRPLFRRLNTRIAGAWWGLSVFSYRYLAGVRYVQTGDETKTPENVIVIANHQNNSDVFTLMPLAIAQGRLGNMKWFAKSQLKWVPGPGWGMQFLDCVFLDRDWTADASKIRKTFAVLNDSPIPFWLVSFPEGTRITSEKLKQSQEFAKRKGFTIPQRVLVPKSRGFVAAVKSLRRAEAVYDVTVGYPDFKPGLGRLFSGAVGEVHVHVRRYPIASLPKDEKALSQWLHDRYDEKDRMLARFATEGKFV